MAGWGPRDRGKEPDISVGPGPPAPGKPAEWAGGSLFWASLPPNCWFHLLSSPSETILSRNETTRRVRCLGKACTVSAPASKTSPLGPASSRAEIPWEGVWEPLGWPWGAAVSGRGPPAGLGMAVIDSLPTPGSPDCLLRKLCKFGGKAYLLLPRPSPLPTLSPLTPGDTVTRSQKAARPRFSLRILSACVCFVFCCSGCYKISKQTPYACSSLTLGAALLCTPVGGCD